MKILILKRDKIGDLLLTTPMLAHLRKRRPDAQIHLLANDYNAWVVADNPNIDKLWIYPRVKIGKSLRIAAVVKQFLQIFTLRRQRYDVVIVAGGEESDRAIKRALRLRGKRTIAYCNTAALKPQLTDALDVPFNLHEVERLLHLLTPLAISMPNETIYPEYKLPFQANYFASQWISERALAPKQYVVLGLGARRAKKQPTTEQILRWSKYFKEALGLDTVFMWTPGSSNNPLYPGDDEIAQPVLDTGLPHIHPFRGPLQPALGLIWQASASIFPDSGLMHFAAASPGGVIGLFAESNISPPPAQWAPRGPRADYLEAEKSVSQLTDNQLYTKLQKLLRA